MKKTVISVVGKDKVGIIYNVCKYLAGNQINILDIAQTIVSDWFNMIMIVNIEESEKDFATIANELKQIGDEIVNDGKGFESFSEVSGGKATLKKGEHELKLEITNDWIDIDYVEFKAVKDSVPDGIAKVRLDMTEAESNYSVYDMHGKKLGTFSAKGMADAMDLVKADAKLRKQSQGVFFIRKDGALQTKKVVVYE